MAVSPTAVATATLSSISSSLPTSLASISTSLSGSSSASAIASASASSSPATDWTLFDGSARCIDPSFSIPSSLNYTNAGNYSDAQLAYTARRYICSAPGCLVVQSWTEQNRDLNVSDMADVERRCEAAGAERERAILQSVPSTGETSVWTYCAVQQREDVQGVIDELVGAVRAKVICSTEAHTRESAAEWRREGRVGREVGCLAVGVAALSMLGSL